MHFGILLCRHQAHCITCESFPRHDYLSSLLGLHTVAMPTGRMQLRRVLSIYHRISSAVHSHFPACLYSTGGMFLSNRLHCLGVPFSRHISELANLLWRTLRAIFSNLYSDDAENSSESHFASLKSSAHLNHPLYFASLSSEERLGAMLNILRPVG